MFSSGEYVIARISKKPIIGFGYPVRNTANRLIAVLVVTLDLDYSQRIFERLHLPPNSSFSLLDHKGIILVRYLKDAFSEKLVGDRDINQELFIKMTQGPDEGTYEAMGNDGNFRLVAYKRISLPHESKPHMYIRSSIPLASATSKANAAMFRNLSVFASLFLIGLFLAWLIGERVIANPLMVLKGASEQLAAGADTVHVSHVVKGGELGEVARTFDAMAESLVQREAALRESEQRWATTLASIGDAVIATDVEGRIAFMNAVAEELTGWTLHDALRKPVPEVFNIINEHTRTQVESPINRVLREGMVVGLANHTILVRKDGTEVPIDDSGAPIKDGGGKTMGVVLVFRDIAERKQAEEQTRGLIAAVQEEKDRLSALVNSIQDEVWFADTRKRFTLANPSALREFGLEVGNGIDVEKFAKSLEVCRPDGTPRPVDEAPPLRALQGDVVRNLEEMVRTPGSGELRYREVSAAPVRDGSGAIIGSVSVVRDITERKQAEEALQKARDELEERVEERTEELKKTNEVLQAEIADRRKAEEALALASAYNRHLIEASIDPLVTIDREGRISDVNAATEQITGYSRTDLIGSDFSDYFTEPEKARDGYRRVFDEGLVRDYPLEIRHRDGHTTPVLYNASVYRDEAGRVIGVFAAARDIADLKQLEAQLRQAQKMEALGTLTGGIAHDFNNVLAAIIGFAEPARDKLNEGSREKRHLQRVFEAGLRGRELVKQMLTFSRQTEQEKKPLQLSSIVKETIKLLRASIPATISIRTDVRSESGLIFADPTQIQQVLMNLCVNATHAMQERGGVLHVELSDFSVSESNGNPHGIKPGLYMRLIVSDTGTGISPDIVDRIFDPFFTTKEQGEGTGLGLSVVHGIVKQHASYITVESESGKGATFTVYLPKIAEKPKTDALPEETIPTGHERILFIDDEEALVEMGEAILTDLGHEVLSRTSSREALALFRLDPAQFDLVITDQTMPEFTGIQLAKEITAIRSDIPIILCTGFGHRVDADTAGAAGIKALSMKPLTKREIAKTIRKVLDEQVR
jgi:PAS domain S-box-containing protein